MPRKKTRVAIIYDFDKTLATTDMQNYSFIKSVGLTVPQFWEATGKFCSENNCDKILGYMYMMIKSAKNAGVPLTRKFLNDCAKEVVLFPGVETWFDRINEYAKEKGIVVEHYICSSGNKEIIEGTSIAKCFKKIFGCQFVYDPTTKEAIWPKNAINYTQKTQYIFRISKHAFDETDNRKVNDKMSDRIIPYQNMIYIGDGLTDVPCMTFLKKQGGISIAIYPKGKKDKVVDLLLDDRVNYICNADYQEGSELDTLVKLILQDINISYKLKLKQKQQKTRESKRVKKD